VYSATNVQVLFIIGFSVVGLCLHSLLKKRMLWGILCIFLIFSAIICAVGIHTGWEFLKSYVIWMLNGNGWNPEWTQGYQTGQIFFLVLGCYLFQFIQEKEFRIKMVVATGLTGYLLYCMLMHKAVSRLGVSFAIVYIVFVLTEWTQRNWKKERLQSVASYMNWFTPFAIIFMIALMKTPASDKPYDWQFVKDASAWIKEELLLLSQELFDKEENPESKFSGFSDEEKLGSGLFYSDKKIMTVKSASTLKTNVYLTGKNFDSFNGTEWTSNIQPYPDALLLDSVNLLSAVKSYDKKYVSDYVHATELEVCYKYLSSYYFFAPLKTWRAEKDGEVIRVTESGGVQYFDEKQDYQTIFRINFYQMNYDSDFFKTLLMQEPSQEHIEETIADVKMHAGVTVLPNQLKEYEEFCYEHYSDEVVLSEAVQTYLEPYLKDADTDMEKIKALEMLLHSYTYTTQPGKIPKTVTDAGSYLDYFLLESKKGYCTHYATAFVLLARAQGIPARYVHGYCVPMAGKKEITVTESMAHAWPEVYIKNVGWIPCEPTPGYSKVRYGSWKTQKGNLVEVKNQSKYYIKHETVDDTENLELSKRKERVSATVRTISDVLVKAGWILVCVIAGMVLIGAETKLFHHFRKSKMDMQKRYRFEIKQIFRVLSALKFQKKAEETVSEFIQQVQKELPDKKTFCFVESYEAVLYGDKAANQTMLKVLLDEEKEFLALLKERNRIRYYVYRFWGR